MKQMLLHHQSMRLLQLLLPLQCRHRLLEKI
jgi:hypothetical protein